MSRHHIAILLLVTASAGACRRSGFVPTPPGETAPPRELARVAYDADVTRADGWRPADSLSRTTAHDYERARDGVRALVARTGALRVLVYYNGTLAPLVSEVRRPAGDVLELDYTESGPRGTTNGRRTLRLVGAAAPPAAPSQPGRQSVDALLAHRLEAAIGQHLLDANARVLDNALLVRQAARAGGGSYSDAEMRALADKVDLVLEVTFVPNPAARDGFELAVRGIRTRDAAVVVHATSAERPAAARTAPQYAVVPSKGFQPVAGARELSLRELCHDVMSDAMQQLASRY